MTECGWTDRANRDVDDCVYRRPKDGATRPRHARLRGANLLSVIIGFDPRIYAPASEGAAWMLGSSPRMTENGGRIEPFAALPRFAC
ncbi:hypothetical protein FHX14_000080 [Rhizobium sp. BK619]|nr:hypothetical protein [Rhizobium sp. BK619]